jgi:hypothetical protein
MSGNRRFYTFLTGSFFASFGGWINFLAILNIATYRFNATPFDLVILSAALLVPPVLLTRTISRVCGRYASTRVLVVALTLTLGTTAALLWVGNFVAFLLVVALKSAALGFTDPSETLYVTTCVDEAQPGQKRGEDLCARGRQYRRRLGRRESHDGRVYCVDRRRRCLDAGIGAQR